MIARASHGSKSTGKNIEPEQNHSSQPQSPSQGQQVLLELSNKDERNISQVINHSSQLTCRETCKYPVKTEVVWGREAEFSQGAHIQRIIP